MAEQFLQKILDSSDFERIFRLAQVPSVEDRTVFYKFFESLSVYSWGKARICSTVGLLVWLTDRTLVIEANPEAVWRFNILSNLVSVPSECKQFIGDHGYLRVKEYLAQGIYYLPPEYRVVVADEAAE